MYAHLINLWCFRSLNDVKHENIRHQRCSFLDVFLPNKNCNKLKAKIRPTKGFLCTVKVFQFSNKGTDSAKSVARIFRALSFTLIRKMMFRGLNRQFDHLYAIHVERFAVLRDRWRQPLGIHFWRCFQRFLVVFS